jgi:carbamoyltransferase
VHKETGLANLVMAGGVALNCVGNGRILREGPFRNIWIQPAAGDAGGALGVALFIWHELLEQPRTPRRNDAQKGSFLGPSYSDEGIQDFLEKAGAVFDTAAGDETLVDDVSALLAREKVVGWFQGRMEFGPRALGARSILGDARSEKMQSVMNLKIKFRESFRPFAPIVLREYVDQYFQMRPGEDSPYMLLVAPVRDEIRTVPDPRHETAFGIEKLNYCRSTLPAVTHVDYSARVQTVDRERHPLLHRLLSRFHERTGCPVLINTSFNVRSEPIVCSPEDAWRCFMATDMDVLVMGRHLLHKNEQRRQTGPPERQAHLAKFQLD